MQQSRKNIVIIFFAVLLIGLVAAWLIVINERSNRARRDVERNLKKFVRSGATAAHMKDLAPHEWRRVHSFGPGGRSESGSKWKGPDCLGETHWGLLFMDESGGEVYVCVARGVIDGPPTTGPACVLNEGAVARIIAKPDGPGRYLEIRGQACP
jgi:hypothetical protein